GGDVARMRADFALGPSLGVEPHENDAGTGVSWMQCQGYWKAGMDADTRNGGARPKRGLFACLHDPSATPSVIDPLEAGPHIVTGVFSREHCCCAGCCVPVGRLRPARAPSCPRKPLA